MVSGVTRDTYLITEKNQNTKYYFIIRTISCKKSPPLFSEGAKQGGDFLQTGIFWWFFRNVIFGWFGWFGEKHILVSAAGENFEVLWYRKSVFPLQNHRKQCQNVEIFACGASWKKSPRFSERSETRGDFLQEIVLICGQVEASIFALCWRDPDRIRA